MKIIEPNIAMPIRKPKPLASEKIELRNSRIGMIGSLGAQLDEHERHGEQQAADQQRPGWCGSPQPCSGPAHAV